MKLLFIHIKKPFKILSIIIINFLTIIVLLSVAAKIKEKEIAEIVLAKIDNSTHIPITINDISLNLIRRFPLATIALDDVWIGSPNLVSISDSAISEEETLAKIKKIYLSVKLRPLFKGEFEIMKVEIKGVEISYILDKQGISNFDFLIDTTLKDTPDTSSVDLSIMLKELSLRDIYCYYYDSLNLISAKLMIPKAKVDGKIKNEYLYGSAKGILKLTNCNYKATNLHLMQETKIDFDVAYSEDKLDLKEIVVVTDGADFSITGSVLLKDTIKTDIHVMGTKINIGELFKYIPNKILTDIGLKKSSGLLTLDASIKGSIADSILPEVKMNVEMKNGSIQYADFPLLKNIYFAGYITNGKMMNNETTQVAINKLHAETEQSSLDMSFNIHNLEHIQYNIFSDLNIDVSEFKKFIPDMFLSDARGRLQAFFTTKGVIHDSIRKDYIDYILETSQLDLTLNNLFIAMDSSLLLDSLSGHLIYDLHHISAHDLKLNLPLYKICINNASFDAQFTGIISELSNVGIDLKSFQINTDSCVLYGSAKIQNLEAPEFNINTEIKLNLSEFKTILDTLVDTLSGEIIAQIASNGKLNLDSISDQFEDLIFENSSIRLNFNKVSIDMPDTLMRIKEFSGKWNLKPDTIIINATHGVYNGIDFNIDSTKIVNIYHSIIKNQLSQLYVEGKFNLGDIDYTMFAPFITENADSTKTSVENNRVDSIITNYSYLIKGKLGIKSFRYNKAIVENISGLFKLTDSLYLIDQFKFNGFGGKHNTSIRFSIKENEKNFWIKNSVEGMNVTQVLKDFDNFKEYYEPAITYENISGILSSNVDAQLLFKGDTMIQNKLYVRGNIKLEKGVIYNYQPVMDMEQYLKGLGNLDKLEFKTINSNIFIFQNVIYVPTTLVISNKLDATALGMKSFGQDYSYHFIVFLSDLLTGKSDKLLKKQDEMGDEISKTDRRGILVKSYSINGKSHNGIDNEKDQSEMRRKIKASEKLLDVRFHPNIVNYNTGVD